MKSQSELVSQPATLDQRLVSIAGPLTVTLPQFKRGSWRTVAELQKERLTNEELRGETLFAANIGLYRVDRSGNVQVGIGGRRVFARVAASDIEHFCERLLTDQDYLLMRDEAENVRRFAKDIVWADASGLDLKRFGDEISYLKIDTRDYDKGLNPEQRKIAEAIHGAGDAFRATMKMLATAEPEIGFTCIEVLDPDYVRKNATSGVMLARPYMLDNFGCNSNLEVVNNRVYFTIDLRGVPRDAGVAANRVSSAYRTILKDPTAAIKEMTPEIADRLTSLIVKYKKRQ